MNQGFPVQLISKLLCTFDGAELEPDKTIQMSEQGDCIKNGSLHCKRCDAVFPIDSGIVNMMGSVVLDNTSSHELQLRNEHAARSVNGTELPSYDSDHHAMEIAPTLEALAIGKDQSLLELGCGDGRYTASLADKCQWIMAVDFSHESLRSLGRRLQDCQNVGLVLGDCATVKVSAAGFDRMLSTLVSNLPTREHRNAMYQLAATGLKPDGHFVFSTHYHGLRQRLAGEEKSCAYEAGGIYRYNFTVSELRSEVREYFGTIKAHPIRIYFPFARTLRLPLVALSRILEHVPILNSLGGLILCTVKHPVGVNYSKQKRHGGTH